MKSEAYTMSKMDDDYLKMAVQSASRAFGVDSEDVMGRRRHWPLAFARLTAYWLLSIGKGYSYSKTGRMFGRDHGTVMNGVKWVEVELKIDAPRNNINDSWASNIKEAFKSFSRFHKVYITSDVYRAQKEATSYVVQPS